MEEIHNRVETALNDGFHCNALIFRYMVLEKVVTIFGTHLSIFEKNELMMIIKSTILPSFTN